MNKKNIALLCKVAAVSVFVASAGAGAETVSVATEKALAGISVSLDKFSDNHEADEAKVVTMEAVTTDDTKEAETTDDKEEVKTEEEVKEEEEKKAEEEKKEAEKKAKEEKEKEEKEKLRSIKLNINKKKLGMAKVNTYLNVRKKPSEIAKVVGKMTKYSGCKILSVKKGWSKIESGKVKGYVKSEFLYTGDEALERAKKVANLRIDVKTQTLNVRFLPSTDSRIYDLISNEDDYSIAKKNVNAEWLKKFIAKHSSKKELKGVNKKEMYKNADDWMCISIDDELAFVNKEYVSVAYKVDKAVKIQKKKKKKKVVVKQTSSNTGSTSTGSSHRSYSSSRSTTSSSSSSSSRSRSSSSSNSYSSNKSTAGHTSSSANKSIVSYAMQFLGNPYVWGGSSLTHGTDCSGFTMSIWAKYGRSLPHSSSGQAACTKTISISQARPGDLFFYGSGGHVSHVAMYIGGGQVIHASNKRDGIKISNCTYRSPIKVGRP